MIVFHSWPSATTSRITGISPAPWMNGTWKASTPFSITICGWALMRQLWLRAGSNGWWVSASRSSMTGGCQVGGPPASSCHTTMQPYHSRTGKVSRRRFFLHVWAL